MQVALYINVTQGVPKTLFAEVILAIQ